MEVKIIYEDENLLVIDKPAGIIVFPAALSGEPRQRREIEASEKTLIDFLLEKFPYLKNVGKPPRYGIIHRLDKDTSGILLVAKNNESLIFFQKQFKKGKIIKKYLALVSGIIKENQGRIETLIGRSPKNRKKQKVYLPLEPGSLGKRKAVTEYEVLKRFKNYTGAHKALCARYTLIEARPETGRKHQIRTQLAYINHPIVGDKLYSFKNQPQPKGLKRQFLHASYLKIKLPNGKEKEFKSELPEDLKKIIEEINGKEK